VPTAQPKIIEERQMSSTGRQNESIRVLNRNVQRDRFRSKPILLRSKIRLLEQLVTELLPGLDSLVEEGIPDVEQGLDFYDEVRRFEIALIRKALIVMNGHQGKAAQLLNINATTLNTKIKNYHLKSTNVAVLTDPVIPTHKVRAR
jgi:DNA-binding NtrC family response regulator